MKCKVTFTKPYPFTPCGTLQYHTGELDTDTGILWVESPQGRFGIHVGSKAVIHQLPGAAATKKPAAKEATAQ